MKKALIGLTAIILSAFIVIIFASAQETPQGTKKAATSISKDCPKGPHAPSCCSMKYGGTSTAKTCYQSNCKEKGCDPANCKEVKCDKTSCKGSCATASCDAKKCEQAKTKTGSEN